MQKHLRLSLTFLILVVLFAAACSPEPRRRSKSHVDDPQDSGQVNDAAQGGDASLDADVDDAGFFDDVDDIAACGNGIFEPGELCDPGITSGPGTCPTNCDDGSLCTEGRLTGSADDCTALCVFDPITTCQSGDGCCPQGCTPEDDSDCVMGCGDGVLDPGESCDPGIESGPGSCPISCQHTNPCLSGTLEGNASTCTARCVYEEITQCLDGDGCCPQGCTGGNDDDCGATCVPLTCSQAGVQCGPTLNGCGSTMNCPDCPDGQACEGGECVTSCVPLTCAQAGVQCGPTLNGCGSTLNCPDCPDGQSCLSGQCQADCVPRTCAQAEVQCGPTSNGCGSTMNCPDCPNGQTCESGQCVSNCVPLTCAQAGVQCGPTLNGCGSTMNCPGCPDGQICESGQCVSSCVPLTCAQAGVQCGPTSNGCGQTMNCPDCPDGQTCESGQCQNTGPSAGAVGDACAGGADCVTGACLVGGDFKNGYCSLVCETDVNCPPGSHCATINDQLRACVKSCASHDQCRSDGYMCFAAFTNVAEENSNECAPAATGSRPIGDACTAVWQCSGGTAGYCKHEWPGGYCTQSCVPLAGTCPTGSSCNWGTLSCERVCFTNADCRAGYSCLSDGFFFNTCQIP